MQIMSKKTEETVDPMIMEMDKNFETIKKDFQNIKDDAVDHIAEILDNKPFRQFNSN